MTNAATAVSLRRLVRVLTQMEVSVTHPVMAALNARVLRPGSSPQSDRMLRGLVDDWEARGDRLGIEIDARVFAYARAPPRTLIGSSRRVQAPQWTHVSAASQRSTAFSGRAAQPSRRRPPDVQPVSPPSAN